MKITKRHVIRLNNTLDNLARDFGHSSKVIVKRASAYFTQSAIKETGPGRGTNIRRLAKKYRLRPCVSVPAGNKWNWYINKNTGYMFDAGKKIRNYSKKGLRKARGIKYWNKKKSAWDYLATRADRMYVEDDPKTRIPNAAAAKAGWLGVKHKMGKFVDADPRQLKFSHYLFRATGDIAGAEMINQIKYTAKRYPTAVPRALRKTTNRIIKVYQKTVEKKIRAIR